ncbi:MAG TPA: ribosome maturation factor RimM, partial [Geothermobacteraceae bacterium]|nr:ribosome maturation factor RimM [Geothermobacteraceae bacterium]
MSTVEDDALSLLGKVIDTHGLRGELKVRTHPEDRDVLLLVGKVYLRPPGEAALARELVKARPNKGYAVIQLKGLDHVSQAAGLVGQELLINPTDIRRDTDRLFWYELSGLQVVDRQRGDIGVLEEMFVTAAHGVYVIRGAHGEILIPAIEPFVLGL